MFRLLASDQFVQLLCSIPNTSQHIETLSLLSQSPLPSSRAIRSPLFAHNVSSGQQNRQKRSREPGHSGIKNSACGKEQEKRAHTVRSRTQRAVQSALMLDFMCTCGRNTHTHTHTSECDIQAALFLALITFTLTHSFTMGVRACVYPAAAAALLLACGMTLA